MNVVVFKQSFICFRADVKFLSVVSLTSCHSERPLARCALVTKDTEALCQRPAAQHRGFVFQTNKSSTPLVTGHKDLLVVLGSLRMGVCTL